MRQLLVNINDDRFTSVRTGLIHGSICLDPFRRGDADENGALELTDAMAALQLLFGTGDVACLDFVDANDDGSVNITDAVYLLLHLFRGGPEPPPPFSNPGLDPTSDLLPCLRPAEC